MTEQRINWGSNTHINLDYSDDLSILDKSVSKMDKLLEVLWVQGVKTGLKINVNIAFYINKLLMSSKLVLIRG